MDELKGLQTLARALGVHTEYTDGLAQHVTVGPETLLRVCAALGAPIARAADAPDALRAWRAVKKSELLPPVLVAWNGVLVLPATFSGGSIKATVHLGKDGTVPLVAAGETLRLAEPLPPGYHRLEVETGGRLESATVISSPVQSWRRDGSALGWGVGSELAALRSRRSRSLGDLRDLETLCQWVGRLGGNLVTVLPLLPTFNQEPAEPSPYSPVSRLFWSELILDLGEAHRPVGPVATLDVRAGDAEVRAALASMPMPDPTELDEELVHYARFRAAQRRLGRNWRDWPAQAREGTISPEQIDLDDERFHLKAQTLLRRQLHELRGRLEQGGVRLGLDLAVGVHPDGFDPWSRQSLFGARMSVGAPPDAGFPSGQDWGFAPVLPDASRREGHRYIAGSIAHQASLAGVLRIDHIMAWTRLYWIPHGMRLDQGTYVTYPAEELFAVLVLESHRNRCEILGENLGNVPKEIDQALPRHRIWGMYLAQFAASDTRGVQPPAVTDVALVGTHDTPPFAGWLTGTDIVDRVRYKLLAESKVEAVTAERGAAIERLAEYLEVPATEPYTFLCRLLEWLGRSGSPLVVPWLEDLWLEDQGVNLPGTPSSVRPNWQRPMRLLLDDIVTHPGVAELICHLVAARAHPAPAAPLAHS
jgi:4-alpha-glucanotransferase